MPRLDDIIDLGDYKVPILLLLHDRSLLSREKKWIEFLGPEFCREKVNEIEKLCYFKLREIYLDTDTYGKNYLKGNEVPIEKIIFAVNRCKHSKRLWRFFLMNFRKEHEIGNFNTLKVTKMEVGNYFKKDEEMTYPSLYLKKLTSLTKTLEPKKELVNKKILQFEVKEVKPLTLDNLSLFNFEGETKKGENSFVESIGYQCDENIFDEEVNNMEEDDENDPYFFFR